MVAFTSSDVFNGFVTAPDGSVYRQTTHNITTSSWNGAAGYGQTWTTLDLVSQGLPGPSATATSTGVNPTETSYSLYGHSVPLSLGKRRIGGEIIAGPWVSGGLATFCISFGVPFDPIGSSCDLREIAFDSGVVWSTNGAAGVTTPAGGTFTVEAFTFRFYPGTLSQAADSIEISHFGSDAVAYRPQILIWFENLPLAGTKFGKIPYVAALVGDTNGDDVNLGDAFELIAYSPWVGLTSGQFETVGITDGVVGGGIIIAQDAGFLELIQQFAKYYGSWDILQTDKLRIVDRGSNLTPDITFDTTRMLGSVAVVRQGQDTVPNDLDLSTIDPDADYTIVTSSAHRPKNPVAVTTSIAKSSDYLPVIMDAATRQALVTLEKYREEQNRKTISGVAMAYGLEIEPGDLVYIQNLNDDFHGETFRIVETLHGANYSVEFTAQSILRCGIGGDAYLSIVVLLLGFESGPGLVDESPAAHAAGVPNSGCAISTAKARFGSASLRCNNNGIVYGGSADWDLSSSNSDQFTIEFSVYFNTVTGVLASQWHALSSGLAWCIEIPTATEFAFAMSTNGTSFDVNVVSSGAALTTGVWYDLAVDKDATGKIRVYKNGAMLGSATPANSAMASFTNTLTLGMTGFAGGPADCWLDEVRITKGLARYASDSGYTVSPSAFPRF